MKWFGGKDFSNENVSDRSPKPVSERQTEKIIAQTEKKIRPESKILMERNPHRFKRSSTILDVNFRLDSHKEDKREFK